jgi:nitroreductase
MDFLAVVRNRRSVREYTTKPIERAQIERLIDNAILAPSAMNQQPWVFAALLDQERIASYALEAKTWLLANISETTFDSARRILEDRTFVLFHGAPALVLVMAKSSESQAIEDCCLAAENLLLAARNEGLGSCWIGFARPWLNSPPIKQKLGLRQEYHVVAPIALGHLTAWPAPDVRHSPEIQWLG